MQIRKIFLSLILLLGLALIVTYQNVDAKNNQIVESSTSMLGHIQDQNAKIYKSIGDNSSIITAGTTYTNKVFYIKTKAEFNGELYYLLSRNAKNTDVVGWIKAKDVWAQDHVTIDKNQKILYLKGTGWAYTEPWGSNQDAVYTNLAAFQFTEFKVNLTERVGNYIWYRGVLQNGKTVWIQAGNLSSEKPKVKLSSTSKLGHIESQNAKIYKSINTSSITAGTTYTNKVFYIKKQVEVSGQLYYLISTRASSVDGTIGWVNSKDIWAQTHVTIDKDEKLFYLKGTGWAYTNPWGSIQDAVYTDLTSFKNQPFKVNLTEQVGNYIWYRGTLLNGKTVWIQGGNVFSLPESSTSMLGHIQDQNAKIYKTIGDPSTSITAGTTYTKKVFYIKKQAELAGELYYLLSRNAKNTDVVGWAKAKDVWAQDHVTIDKNQKILYLKGTGWAYTEPWGSVQDAVYTDLTSFKNQPFKVNLTEQVGDYIWYRGTLLNGKTVWIQAGNVFSLPESNTSMLGHIQDQNAKIYKIIGDPSTSITAGTTYTKKVFYIKKQTEFAGELYYLLSRNARNTDVIGWAKAKDVWAQNHVTIDKHEKLFLLKGTGWAYTEPWGSVQDAVYTDLSAFKDQIFRVNLTEQVGDYLWHRGVLPNGKVVWIQAGNLTAYSGTKYTYYNITFSEALKRQMNTSPPPQTDLYRNIKTAYVHNDYIAEVDEITGDSVNLRSSPTTKENNVQEKVDKGTAVKVLGTVNGESVNGTTLWYKIEYKNKTLYVHSSYVKRGVYKTTTRVNVREAPNSSSHIFGTLSANTTVNIIKKGSTYHEISYTTTWRNAKQSDVQNYMDPSKNDKFQHLLLSGTAGVSANELKNLLNGKGVLHNKQDVFIQASRLYNVNEVYLVAHALHETGNGTSKLAKGVQYNGKTVYNMFGIAAYDSDPVRGGARKAYELGWFSVDAAILGGAKWISENYVNHPKYQQNTLYKMRWNPSNPGVHQYATDIGWAVKQIDRIKKVYDQLPNAQKFYDIPVYK